MKNKRPEDYRIIMRNMSQAFYAMPDGYYSMLCSEAYVRLLKSGNVVKCYSNGIAYTFKDDERLFNKLCLKYGKILDLRMYGQPGRYYAIERVFTMEKNGAMLLPSHIIYGSFDFLGKERDCIVSDRYYRAIPVFKEKFKTGFIYDGRNVLFHEYGLFNAAIVDMFRDSVRFLKVPSVWDAGYSDYVNSHRDRHMPFKPICISLTVNAQEKGSK